MDASGPVPVLPGTILFGAVRHYARRERHFYEKKSPSCGSGPRAVPGPAGLACCGPAFLHRSGHRFCHGRPRLAALGGSHGGVGPFVAAGLPFAPGCGSSCHARPGRGAAGGRRFLCDFRSDRSGRPAAGTACAGGGGMVPVLRRPAAAGQCPAPACRLVPPGAGARALGTGPPVFGGAGFHGTAAMHLPGAGRCGGAAFALRPVQASLCAGHPLRSAGVPLRRGGAAALHLP